MRNSRGSKRTKDANGYARQTRREKMTNYKSMDFYKDKSTDYLKYSNGDMIDGGLAGYYQGIDDVLDIIDEYLFRYNYAPEIEETLLRLEERVEKLLK